MKDEGLGGETRLVPFFAPGHGIHTLFVVKPLGKRGIAEGEAPVGCVLALGSGPDLRVVARGHNQLNALGRRTAHAEMVAFESADSRDGRPPTLPLDAEAIIMVSTLEPCVMCLGAAMEAGAARVLFGLNAPTDNGTQQVKPPESPKSGGWKVRRAQSRPSSWSSFWR